VIDNVDDVLLILRSR